MPIVKVYTDSITVRGHTDKESHYFYHQTKTAYGETEGEFLDEFVHTARLLALEAQEWLHLNKPEGYLLRDDNWLVSMSELSFVRGLSASPIISLPSIVTTAVKIRNETVLKTAEALAEQAKTTVQEILPQIEKRATYGALSRLEDSTDHSVFEELTHYGYTGAHLDEMMAKADKEGYLYAERRLNCQWQ